MFVAPALFASACDAIVLYMASQPPPTSELPEIARHGWINVQSSHYLIVLAIIRLGLLFGPLSYHTYLGTRVYCQSVYYMLHVFTYVFILGHMLCIIMLDPDSLGSLLPLPGSLISGRGSWGGEDSNGEGGGNLAAAAADATSESGSDPGDSESSIHLASMRHVWIILSLSLVSTTLHVIILLHVRSSAPSSTAIMNERKRGKKKMLAYYAYRRYYDSSDATSNGSGATGLLTVGGAKSTKKNVYNSIPADDGPQITPDNSVDGDTEQGAFRDTENDGESGIQNGGAGLNRSDSFGSAFGRYDEFMSDLQNRLDYGRRQWSSRLEDVTRSIQSQIRGEQHDAEEIDQLGGRSPSHWPGPSGHMPFVHLSPFRALLQLYAYEDVFTNHKLERAFSSNDDDTSDALAFYAPQLLSFLLHGAFLNSPQLEEWILDKCRKDIHFAHRCFWFLRAWCLGRGSHSHDAKSSEISRRRSNASISSLENGTDAAVDKLDGGSMFNSISKRHGSEANLYLEGDPETVLTESGHVRRSSSSGNLQESPSGDRGSKFPQEEHHIIELLLFKVIECGEAAARPLHVAPAASINDSVGGVAAHSPHVKSAAESVQLGLLPIHPGSGQVSESHLATLQATEKYGFLPLTQGSNGQQLPRMPSDEDGVFLSAPKFFDALTSIADDLMLENKPNRTAELRRRLRMLEVELLPSNAVYIPVSNAKKHRVWRIVASESVALSTNERVPCIIPLETIMYDETEGDLIAVSRQSSIISTDEIDAPPSPGPTRAKAVAANKRPADILKFLSNSSLHVQATAKSEREILDSWIKSERPAQRHNTILDKFRVLPHLIGESFHNQNEKMFSNHDVPANWRGMMSASGDQAANISSAFDTDLEAGDASREAASDAFSKANDDISTLNQEELAPRPPLPPLRAASETASVTPSTPGTPYSASHSSPPSSRASSRPPSPNTTMGQWHSPLPSIKRKLSVELLDLNINLESEVQGEMGDALQMPSINDSPMVEKASVLSSSLGQQSLSARAKGGRTRSFAPLLVPPDHKQDKHKLKKKKKKRSRPPPVVFKEDWSAKEDRIRSQSAYGSDPRWRLLPILIKSNDDLRQEQLASQLIHRMAAILARAKVPVWLYPYEILALTDRGGIMEAIPDTISIDSLKKNDPDYVDLKTFFDKHFGPPGCDEHANAKANFVESMAAYSVVCYLLQIKDRHNGNILLTNKGRIIHIDFGFFFLSSPGKNSGFESAPFKLTRDFVDVMDGPGPDSRAFAKFKELCCKTFLELRRHCYQIILLVEMLTEGGEDLQCFCGKPQEAIEGLRERFRLDLTDRACVDYVNGLVDESCGNWRTVVYDRYQRLCVGVL